MSRFIPLNEALVSQLWQAVPPPVGPEDSGQTPNGRDTLPASRFKLGEPSDLGAARALLVRAPSTRETLQPLSAFLSKYEPLAYALDGVLRSGSVYTLTAKTGSGKTAFNVILSLAVATGEGKRLLGRDVEQGRVLYVALENPDDVRMRFLAACYLLNINAERISDRLVILEVRRKTEDILADLRREADPFRIVIVDTFAAHFDGADVNNPVESGEFMRRYRPISQLPGRPTVLVSAHPTKNASDSNLIPYGAGAILNEVDGNLTLENNGGCVTLHWQGKIRGADFEPIAFRIEAPPCPDIVDVKGREIATPVLLPSTIESVSRAEKADQDIEIKLLSAMDENPSGTQDEWAKAIGRAKSSVNDRLKRLKGQHLVEHTAGVWLLTQKAKRAVKAAKEDAKTPNEQPEQNALSVRAELPNEQPERTIS